MNKLEQSRKRIDEIDSKIVELFAERMGIAGDVAKYKVENNLPVLNSTREREIITRLIQDKDEVTAQYIKSLYLTVFDISRSYQEVEIMSDNAFENGIIDSINTTDKFFPKQAVVACQGTDGSYSSSACDKMFPLASIMFMKSFEAVFRSVESGLCRYGILPIENSLHGSVTQVYDLMKKYSFQIVRSVKVKIDHCLLLKPGVKIEDVKEIYSHSQALAQCSDFINGLKGVEAKEWNNTATAAEMVANSDRNDIAAIADTSCSSLFNLEVAENHIQNRDNNYTRFICISKKPEIYPGADKISIMFTVPHRPGSLYNIITKFSVLGVNLSKLESRPIPEQDFEFVFYADFDADIADTTIQKLLVQLKHSTDTFTYLGSYREV